MEDTSQERKKQTKKAIVTEKEEESAEERVAVVEEEEWRDWSCSLTQDLLISIVSFLVTLSDFSSFNAVCRSWRSSSSCVVSRLTMSSQSPLCLLYHRSRRAKFFFDATHHRIYKSPRLPYGIRICRIFGYTHGHLVTAPGKHDRPLLLVNVFTGTKTKLPSTPTPTDDEFVPEQLFLSSSPSSPGCIAILIGTSRCFFYCRLGDPHWRRYRLPPPHSVVFIGNRLYALTADGRLGFFSFASPGHTGFTTVSKDTSINVLEEANSSWCLAESAGDLLAVRCTWGAPFEFDIWRWDSEGGCEFVEVSNLGERALFFANERFVGSVTASVRSGIKRNSIYHINRYGCWGYSLDTKTEIDGFTEFPEYYRYDTIPVWILPSLC